MMDSLSYDVQPELLARPKLEEKNTSQTFFERKIGILTSPSTERSERRTVPFCIRSWLAEDLNEICYPGPIWTRRAYEKMDRGSRWNYRKEKNTTRENLEAPKGPNLRTPQLFKQKTQCQYGNKYPDGE